jgi:5,10-methylenetetrahydrofolate reductase
MSLESKFEAGEFAVLAEFEPPKGVDVAMMAANARKVKGIVDAFLVPEMSSAVMRISSLGGALVLQKQGLETVLQVCCRDRNRLALQGDLLAAYACGITNVMAVTGEDPGFGDHHQARSVYDIDLIELLEVIKALQKGRDMAGIELAGAPQFIVGSTADIGAKGKSPDLAVEEMLKRNQAGATFFITPPLFDLPALDPFLQRVDRSQVTIIPTVLLLKSLGMARYIQRNVAHIYIPDELVTRLQRAPDKVRECVKIASETVAELKAAGFSGVLLSTMGWEHKLSEIIEGI